MGFLTKLTPKSGLHRLPSGTFTVDPNGEIVSSTVPQWVPEAQVEEIGREILAVFRAAGEAHLQFSEMKVQYEAFKITAREMRGGAIIYLSPKTMQGVAKT
jgi:hypothetical protein